MGLILDFYIIENLQNYLDVEESSLEVRFVEIESLHGTGLVQQVVDQKIDTETG